VRVFLAFHVAPSEEVAQKILMGNFAILAELDPGFFGQGIYFTLDAQYALEEYGRGDAAVPLLICAVARWVASSWES